MVTHDLRTVISWASTMSYNIYYILGRYRPAGTMPTANKQHFQRGNKNRSLRIKFIQIIFIYVIVMTFTVYWRSKYNHLRSTSFRIILKSAFSSKMLKCLENHHSLILRKKYKPYH